MPLQKKDQIPISVKLEMTAKELEMMVYMLGAIDLRTDPTTLDVALALRKKLDNALKFFKAKPKPQKDKYGKPMSEEEIKKAQEVASLAAAAQAEEERAKVIIDGVSSLPRAV